MRGSHHAETDRPEREMSIFKSNSRRQIRSLGIGVALSIAAWNASAIVVDDTTALNQSPPSNGGPWKNVGLINGASGVYLKNGWVITAQHVVGAAQNVSISFAGIAFNSTGPIITLTNPDNSPSDLVLFNIGAMPPGAANLGIAPGRPSKTNALLMIGYGQRRAGALEPIACETGTVKGYRWDGVQTKSWGINRCTLDATGMVQVPGHNAFLTFITVFTANGFSGTAQASLGDSGGGVFMKSGKQWTLAGTMNSVSGVRGQTPNTSVNGNATCVADLSAYAASINSVISPKH